MIELKKPIQAAYPIAVISLSFAMKKEMSLDDMQMFIIKCIKKGLKLQALCEITQFSETVVEKVLLDMKEQGLIDSANDFYTLSEVSERVLKYSDWAKILSDSKKQFAFDMIDGRIMSAEGLCLSEKADCIRFKSKAYFNSYNLADYLSENLDLMKQSYDLFSDITNDEIKNFLNSIIVTANGKSKWQLKNIISLPEWPEALPDKEEDTKNNLYFIRLYMKSITYSVHNKRFEVKENLLKALKTVQAESPSFLKANAVSFINAYEKFYSLASQDFSICISPVTGKIIRKPGDITAEEKLFTPVLEIKPEEKRPNNDSIIQLFGFGEDYYFMETSDEAIPFDAPLLPEMHQKLEFC